MSISQEIRDRIFAAADNLYASSENSEYPSIEEVRIASRAGMQNVVSAMKEWRKAQRTHVHIVKEPIPNDLMAIVHSAGQTIWQAAQTLANASLVTATEAFEDEKQTLVDISNQQSQSYEELEYKLTDALSDKENLEIELSKKTDLVNQFEARVIELESKIADYKNRASVAEGKLEQSERTILSVNDTLIRVDKQLAEKVSEVKGLNNKLAVLEEKSEAQIAGKTSELEKINNKFTELESKLDEMRVSNSDLKAKISLAESAEIAFEKERQKFEKELLAAVEQAALARENAAKLSGKLEAISSQVEGQGKTLGGKPKKPNS